MSAIVFAYHDVGCLGLRVLQRLGIDIAAVYTHPDDPGENAWFGSVRATCEELRIPVLVGNDPNSAVECARMRSLAPRAMFSFYYRDMLRDEVIGIPKLGGVNLHGSLLPRYRGRAPVNWQILHGEREGGVTLHYMVKRADAGDIVDQVAFEIGPDDTAVDVYAKMRPAAERVLVQSAVAVMEGTAPRTLQLESKATKFGRRTPADGRIEWRHAAEDVRNLVRAVTHPYPGAFTHAGGQRVLVWWTEHDSTRTPRPSGPAADVPGQITRGPDGVFVTCGDLRKLRLTRVEIEGRAGDALDFPYILAAGTILSDGPSSSR